MAAITRSIHAPPSRRPDHALSRIRRHRRPRLSRRRHPDLRELGHLHARVRHVLPRPQRADSGRELLRRRSTIFTTSRSNWADVEHVSSALRLVCRRTARRLRDAVVAARSSYDVVIRGGTDLRRQRRRALCRRRRDRGRPHRRRRRRGVGPAARREIDARGLAVAPGFINMLSWATEVADRGRPRPERHPPGRDPRGDGRGLVDGPAQRGDEAARASSARATSATRSPGPASANISSSWSGAASRPTSPASSARPRSASTSSAKATSIRRPSSWPGCARWCARR